MGSNLSGHSPVGRGSERGGRIEAVNPEESVDTRIRGLRYQLGYGYTIGNEFLAMRARSANSDLRLALQAQAAFHGLLHEGLTSNRSLGEVMHDFGRQDLLQEVVPEVAVDLEIDKPSHRVTLFRLPIVFITAQLEESHLSDLAQKLNSNGSESLLIADNKIDWITNLVAERMRETFEDHGGSKTLEASEIVVQQALAGRAFRLPGIR